MKPLRFICPMCKTHWANVVVMFDSPLKSKDIKIIPPFKRAKAITKKGVLKCPKCSVVFSLLHVQVMIARGLNETDQESGKTFEEKERSI